MVSDDDEVNLKVSLKVHSLKINTHILDGGVVASGGTDFFPSWNKEVYWF